MLRTTEADPLHHALAKGDLAAFYVRFEHFNISNIKHQRTYDIDPSLKVLRSLQRTKDIVQKWMGHLRAYEVFLNDQDWNDNGNLAGIYSSDGAPLRRTCRKYLSDLP